MADALSRPANPGQCPIRALQSLRAQDVLMTKTMLSMIGGAWHVDAHDDYAGNLSLLLTPAGPGRDRGFMLYRDAAGIHLADIANEGFVRLGTFKALSAAILYLRRHRTAVSQATRAA